jgi:hypothetical protein
MDILTGEAKAYLRAADVAGLELPAAITEARANLGHVEEQIAALPAPAKVPSTAELVARGMPVDRAADEHERLTQEEGTREEMRRSVNQARGLAWRRLSQLVAQERDNLVHALRPIVTDLVEAARPHAETLAPWAPKYDAEAIVRRGTPKDMKAYQAAAELEVKFGACMAAWRASFQASTTRAGGWKSPAHVPGFDSRWVEQVHRYWERPELVQNPRLNGTHVNQRGYPTAIQPTVLGVAAESPDAGFRLATVWELKELYDGARIAAIEAERERVAQALGARRRGARSV